MLQTGAMFVSFGYTKRNSLEKVVCKCVVIKKSTKKPLPLTSL